MSARRLALGGLLVLLIALRAIVVLCLTHKRVRQEEAAEEYLRQERITRQRGNAAVTTA
jgi:hypothetical protein